MGTERKNGSMLCTSIWLDNLACFQILHVHLLPATNSWLRVGSWCDVKPIPQPYEWILRGECPVLRPYLCISIRTNFQLRECRSRVFLVRVGSAATSQKMMNVNMKWNDFYLYLEKSRYPLKCYPFTVTVTRWNIRSYIYIHVVGGPYIYHCWSLKGHHPTEAKAPGWEICGNTGHGHKVFAERKECGTSWSPREKEQSFRNDTPNTARKCSGVLPEGVPWCSYHG